MPARLRTFPARVAAVAVAGLVARLVVVFGPGRHVEGIGDWFFFHRGANLIADGSWFVDPLGFTGGINAASAGHPPLWELLLGGFSTLGLRGPLEHRAVGCVLGAVLIVLVALLARRIAGERAGLVAAVLAAAYPVLIAADTSLLSETLYGVLVAAALLLALRLRDRGDVPTALALGAVLGLAALTRSEGLVLVVVLALPVALLRPERRWVRAAACLAACALVIAPWTIRNWAEFGRPVLISTNDGTVLSGANCDQTYGGEDLGLWKIECISRPSPDRNEAEQSAVWRADGLSYVSDHLPRLVAVVIPVRLLRTWDLYQPRRMVELGEGRWQPMERAGVLAYFLLMPFALAGGWMMRRRRGELLILLAPVAAVCVQTVIGYGVPRFRHAAEITIVVLAAIALVAAYDRLRERRAAQRGTSTS